MLKTILLLETIANEAMQLLEAAPDVTILEGFDDASLEKHIGSNQIDAIITRGKGQVRKALIDKLPHLKVISRCGVGLDNIDVSEATRRNIKVVNAPNSNADTIAEHTIALLLMLQRNLYQAITMTKESRWADRSNYKGDETHGKTIGIIGMGNIGKKVAKIACALGMNIVYWSAKQEEVPYPFLPFDELISTSDILSLHLPLTPKTKNLIDAIALSKMKPSALLINTARGGIINQDALLKVLKDKKLGGFAADFLSEEPPQENDPLLQLNNVMVTAHLGSLTSTTYTKMCTITVENTLAILQNKTPMQHCIFNENKLAKS